MSAKTQSMAATAKAMSVFGRRSAHDCFRDLRAVMVVVMIRGVNRLSIVAQGTSIMLESDVG